LGRLADTIFVSSPWQLGIAGWWRVFKRTAGHINEHRLFLTSAGVAFYGFMSLFPALAALVFVYGLVTDTGDLQRHMELISGALPDSAISVITSRLETVVEASNSTGVGVGLLVSLIITFWSASRGVAALVEIIGVAYRQVDSRSIIQSAALSLILTMGILVMLLFTLSAVAGLPVVISFLPLPDTVQEILLLGRWPIILLAVCTSLVVLYRLAPDRRMAQIRWVVPGALMATLLWGVMSAAFSIYVENFSNYEVTFGAIASVIILMLWLNYSILIITLGAELNAELELVTRLDTTTAPIMPKGKRGAVVADRIKPLD
jgi:membrane protein